MPKLGFSSVTISTNAYKKLQVMAKDEKRSVANYLELLIEENY